MEGWICVHRRMCEHWLWNDKPFSRGQAFIDLLLTANHTDKETIVGNAVISVKRGSFITSQMKLSERWGWSKTKVLSFLRLLENEKMIVVKTDRKKTAVNIVNYDKYQISETAERPKKDRKKTIKKPQKNTTNNENNENNEDNIPPLPPKQPPVKNHYAEFVTMTNDEYQSLIDRFGKNDTNRLVEILDNYKGSTGRKYQSDYRAILSWCVQRLGENRARRDPQRAYQVYEDNYNHDELEELVRRKLENNEN